MPLTWLGPPNSKQCQINTANRFTTTRMHEWCEKAPLTAVEESRHLGAKVFDKKHNKITIKMAKIPKQC